MSLAYTLRESFSGFKRTKLSSAASIATIGISLLLLGIFAVLTITTQRFMEVLRSKVEMEAFLREPVTDEEISLLRRTVEGFEGVQSVTFVSKEEAARIFEREFGEEIESLLNFNPLPPSFRIALRPSHAAAARARDVAGRISTLQGIDSVYYRKALLELVDERTSTVNTVTLVLGIVISLSAIILVSNTIRLAIYAKRKLIRTMELVGATRTFIRLPFLIEGAVQGLLGGTLAGLVLYLLVEHGVRLVSADLAELVHLGGAFYFAVGLAGTALGLLGSLISVTRLIRPAGP